MPMFHGIGLARLPYPLVDDELRIASIGSFKSGHPTRISAGLLRFTTIPELVSKGSLPTVQKKESAVYRSDT